MLQKISKILTNALLLFILLIGILVVASFAKVPGGIKLFTVMSGSMEPALHTGSVIFVRPADEYKIGDIVTKKTEKQDVTITHRIISSAADNGEILFETKGDANDAADSEKFGQSDIVGKEFLTVPLLGYLVNFAKTKQGILLLVVIPAIVIIYEEIGKIVRELQRMRATKKASENSAYYFSSGLPSSNQKQRRESDSERHNKRV